jgi:murein DD-endopeptidase MepM/ murein hydrolase activator NlpD
MRARLVALTCLLAILLAIGAQPPKPAVADTAGDLTQAQAEAALINEVRAKLSGSLADQLSAQQQLEQSLKLNAQQQDATRKKISDANARIDALDQQIAATDRAIKATQLRVEVERAQLKTVARSIYAQPGSVLVQLAQSTDLSDLISRVTELNVAGNRARALKKALLEDEAKLDVDQAKQQVDREEQVKIRQSLAADLEVLLKLQREQEDSRTKLQAKISQTRTEIDALASQSAALAKQITDLLLQQELQIVAAAMQQVWDQVQMWERQNGGSLGLGPSPGHSRTRMMWPMATGTISQGFGPSSLTLEPPGFGYSNFHTGIDLCNPTGTPILAADDGIVALVGSGTSGYGNYVVVAHSGGLTSLYAHMARSLVKVGDKIVQSQPIGLEGSTGLSTGPHLHFEVRTETGGIIRPVDPTPFLPPGGPSSSKG